jgi:hypothetical protein
MTPAWRVDLDELDNDEEFGGRTSNPPERSNRSNLSRRVQKRARRSRSNETAKRGMHQRRNKRIAW